MRPKHPLDKILDTMKRQKKIPRTMRPATRRGEKVQTAKLTADDVGGIRAGYMLGFSTADLSRNFSSLLTLRHDRDITITRQQVWRIVARKDWKHLPDPKVRLEDLEQLASRTLELPSNSLNESHLTPVLPSDPESPLAGLDTPAMT